MKTDEELLAAFEEETFAILIRQRDSLLDENKSLKEKLQAANDHLGWYHRNFGPGAPKEWVP